MITLGELVESKEQRRFDLASLDQAIDRAMAALPANKAGMVIGHLDQHGAMLSAIVRKGDNWSILVRSFKPYNGPLEADLSIRYTFP